MYRDLEHPEVSMALRTGYPSWKQERADEDYTAEDAYDDYCDSLYEERRDQERWGD